MSGSRAPGQHLSDEQFGELLAGESVDGHAEAHLAGCPPCRAEVEAMKGSLAEFNAFSLIWAEREAFRRVPTPSRWTLRLSAHPVWNAGVMAAAACMALAAGLHVPHHATAAPPAVPATQAQGAAPTGAELAEDNRLLTSIHQELSDTAQPTVPLDELNDTGHHAPAEFREAVAN